MSAYTEQEELEKLKAWWKEYGNALLVGVAVGVALLFGGKYWKERQERQRVEASEVYEQMLQARQRSDAGSIRDLGGKLVKDYDDTAYAGMAALMLARAAVEAGDMAGARSHLEWAMAHGRDANVEHIARLRLGRVLLSGGEGERALALVPPQAPAGYQSDYLELKGDALAVLGRRAEALAAYQEAAKLARAGGVSPTLTLKLDELSAAAGSAP